MIRKVIYRICLFAAFVPLLSGCEGLDDCMICQMNTYEDGVLIIEGAETEYCGADLVVIRNTPNDIDPPYLTKWECR